MILVMNDASAFTHADVVCIGIVSRHFIGSFQNDPRVVIYNKSVDIRISTIIIF